MTKAPIPRHNEPKSGVALWRRIADTLRQEVVAQQLPPGTPLPTEAALTARFGVNRHTVRVALKALAEEGLLRAEQGRGTFVGSARRFSYRLSNRTRLSESLSGSREPPTVELLEQVVEPADTRAAVALRIEIGVAVLRMEALSRVDGRPLGCSTHFLTAGSYPGFASIFAATGSMTRAFGRFGVTDYFRLATTVSARPAEPDEARHLELAPGATLLVSEGVDADATGTRLQLVISRFAATRVELVVGTLEP